MTALALLLLLAQPAAVLDGLTDESRAVRERAVAALAESGPPAAELVRQLSHDDPRVVRGVAEVLRVRGDVSVLPELARYADHPDPQRARPAVRALVALALPHRAMLEDLASGRPRLAARLDAEVAAAVEEHLRDRRGAPNLDFPHAYRPLYAGGRHAAKALRAVLEDRRGDAFVRAHALHALARLQGAGAYLERALDDPAPEVRSAAAALVWRYAHRQGLERLVDLLESDRALQPGVRSYAAAAAERLGRLGPKGAVLMERTVTNYGLFSALGAAAALKASYPERAAKVVRGRVLRLLDVERKAAGGGAGAALLDLRVGPLPAGLRARMAATGTPLLQAAATDDSAEALAHLEPVVAPARIRGNGEAVRVRGVYKLLRKHRAPAVARVAFAGSVLDREASGLRIYGLYVLRGVDPKTWRPLRPSVERALESGRASVRLAAAALLPDRALPAVVDALYDGDPRHARSALRILRAHPHLPSADRDATVAERRRHALRLREALADKE